MFNIDSSRSGCDQGRSESFAVRQPASTSKPANNPEISNRESASVFIESCFSTTADYVNSRQDLLFGLKGRRLLEPSLASPEAWVRVAELVNSAVLFGLKLKLTI